MPPNRDDTKRAKQPRRDTAARMLACYLFLFLTLTPLLSLGRMGILVMCCAMLSGAGYGLMCYFFGQSSGHEDGYADGHRDGHEAGRRQPPPPAIPKPRRPTVDWVAVDHAFSTLPNPVNGLGYIYVVRYANGTIKVGQSRNPRNRVRQHRSQGSAFGVHATDLWVSQPHRNYPDNEARLIKLCRRKGSCIQGEYFSGIDFDVAVSAAKALTYRGVPAGVTV